MSCPVRASRELIAKSLLPMMMAPLAARTGGASSAASGDVRDVLNNRVHWTAPVVRDKDWKTPFLLPTKTDVAESAGDAQISAGEMPGRLGAAVQSTVPVRPSSAVIVPAREGV